MKGLKKIINSTLLLGMQLRMFYLFFSLRVFEMSFCSAGMLQLLFPLHARIEAFLGGSDLGGGVALGIELPQVLFTRLGFPWQDIAVNQRAASHWI